MFSPAFNLNLLTSFALLVNIVAFLGGRAYAAPTPVTRSTNLAHRTVKAVASNVPADSCATECSKAFPSQWLLCAIQCTSSGVVEWDSTWDSNSLAVDRRTVNA